MVLSMTKNDIPKEIKTTELGRNILKYAENVLSLHCTEDEGENTAPCIKDMWEVVYNGYYDQHSGSQRAYCAVFVSYCIQQALKEYGYSIDDLKTQAVFSSGTLNLLAQAKQNGIPINSNAKPGAIFQKDGSSGKNRHVGIVWYLHDDGKYFQTIEGNADGTLIESADEYIVEGVVTKKRSLASINHFIHIEEFLGDNVVTHRPIFHTALASINPIMLVAGISMVLGGMFYFKKQK